MAVYRVDWLSGQAFINEYTPYSRYPTKIPHASKLTAIPHTPHLQATSCKQMAKLASVHEQRSTPSSVLQPTSRHPLEASIGSGGMVRLPSVPPTTAQKTARRKLVCDHLNTWLDGIDMNDVPNDLPLDGTAYATNGRNTDTSCSTCGNRLSSRCLSPCSAVSDPQNRHRARSPPRQTARIPPSSRSKAIAPFKSSQWQPHSSCSFANDHWLDGLSAPKTKSGKHSRPSAAIGTRYRSNPPLLARWAGKASPQSTAASRRWNDAPASVAPLGSDTELEKSGNSSSSVIDDNDISKEMDTPKRPRSRSSRKYDVSQESRVVTHRHSALATQPTAPLDLRIPAASPPDTFISRYSTSAVSNTMPQLPSLPKRAFLVPKSPCLSRSESIISSPSLYWQHNISGPDSMTSPLPPVSASLLIGSAGSIGTAKRIVDFRRGVLQASLESSPPPVSVAQMSPTLSLYIRKAKAEFADVLSLPQPAATALKESFGKSSLPPASRPDGPLKYRTRNLKTGSARMSHTDYLFKIARSSPASPAAAKTRSPTASPHLPNAGRSPSSAVYVTASTSRDDVSLAMQEVARRPTMNTSGSSNDHLTPLLSERACSFNRRQSKLDDREISSLVLSSSSTTIDRGHVSLGEVKSNPQHSSATREAAGQGQMPKSALKKRTADVAPDTKPFFRKETYVGDDSDDDVAGISQTQTGDIEQVPLSYLDNPDIMAGAVMGDVPKVGSRFMPAWLHKYNWYTPRPNVKDPEITISANPFIYWLPGAEIKEATAQVRIFSFGKKARRLAWSYHQDLEDCNQHRLKYWLLAIDKLHELCRDMGNSAANGTFRRHHADFKLRIQEVNFLVNTVSERAERMAQYSAQAFFAAESIINTSDEVVLAGQKHGMERQHQVELVQTFRRLSKVYQMATLYFSQFAEDLDNFFVTLSLAAADAKEHLASKDSNARRQNSIAFFHWLVDRQRDLSNPEEEFGLGARIGHRAFTKELTIGSQCAISIATGKSRLIPPS